MNRLLWRIRARDEEPTLRDVIDLLEEALTQGERQKERTLKLHERVSQMGYEMGKGFIAARGEFIEIRNKLAALENENFLMKALFLVVIKKI